MNRVRQLPKAVGKSVAALARGRHVIVIPDAPPLVPRYGHGRPPHALLAALIERGRAGYRRTLADMLPFTDDLARIPRERPAHVAVAEFAEPCWNNRWLPGLDSAALYGMIVLNRPKRYVEIGSGNSTLFARRAIRDQGLSTTITSIDPQPREIVDGACDVVVRSPVQDADLALFDDLEPGDILFVDSSHRAFTNSDVTVVFLDILPRLRPGVLVQFHDIWLPEDYQPAWSNRYYNEQYLLATMLLLCDRFEIVLPNHFITHDEPLRKVLAPLWSRPELAGIRRDGASFWIRRRP